jgi:hypothetical protein
VPSHFRFRPDIPLIGARGRDTGRLSPAAEKWRLRSSRGRKTEEVFGFARNGSYSLRRYVGSLTKPPRAVFPLRLASKCRRLARDSFHGVCPLFDNLEMSFDQKSLVIRISSIANQACSARGPRQHPSLRVRTESAHRAVASARAGNLWGQRRHGGDSAFPETNAIRMRSARRVARR